MLHAEPVATSGGVDLRLDAKTFAGQDDWTERCDSSGSHIDYFYCLGGASSA